MTKKLKDIVAAVGEYEKDGETRKRWQNVGALMEADDGNQFILLERWFNPAGLPNPQQRTNVLLSLFGADKQSAPAHNTSKAVEPELNSDIPF